MNKIIMALPKGRILKELVPLLEKANITPEKEFFNPNSRKLLFTTNLKKLSIIKVRSFDVATFVAFGEFNREICQRKLIQGITSSSSCRNTR